MSFGSRARLVLLLSVIGLVSAMLPAAAAPAGTDQFSQTSFDVIAFGEDGSAGAFGVFLNANLDGNDGSVHVEVEGDFGCIWNDSVAPSDITDSSASFTVSGDCDGNAMMVTVSASYTTSPFRSHTNETGYQCKASGQRADYFEAVVTVERDGFDNPVEITTDDTHYQMVEGYCHATGSPGNPHG